LFDQAVQMARANQDTGEEARYLANLAWVHNRQGLIAQAASEYAALLPMVEKDRQSYQYAVAIGNYAFCLITLGEFDRALALHNEALALFTAQGKETERANELNALGNLYLRIGDSERALEILRAAAAIQERVDNRIGQAASLRLAGRAASSLGRHDEALDLLRKSIEIEANRVNVARTRVLIAAELRALGNLHGAEAELVEAFKFDNALLRANALVERARLRNAQGKPAAAIADLRAGDKVYTDIALDFDRIDINTALSRLLLSRGDVAGAAAAADQAVAINGRIRERSANPEWRARFLSSRYAPFEARIAADLAQGGPDAEWRAFSTAENVRARSLADELVSGSQRASDDAALEGLRVKLTALQLRLEARTQRQGADDPTAVELRRAVEETRAQIEAGRTSVAAGEAALIGSLREVQQALPRDAAVLEFFVGDHESHAWLLTRDSFRHRKLAGLAGLDKAITAAAGRQSGTFTPGTALHELGTMLFGDLLNGVGATRLLVIPDGPLNGVPFSALPAGRNSLDTILDRFVLGYAPSLNLALRTPDRAPPRHIQVAVVSDPVYAADDRRLRLAMNSSTTLRGPREPSPNNFTRLVHSAAEARAVVKALGSKETIELAGFDATPERVLALTSRDLGVLHFATHAAARRDSPDQSALFLSEYAPDGAPLADSRITVDEIARSGLRADVVVLSGCATGDGSELRGEGVLGLTYGFLANGSHAVVASLWPIEDASTARFMNEFYSAYRADGRPAHALRTAQLRTRDIAATAVWSSFVVRANGFP
jgi:tetratricopeptide (TPR) repeat protein